MHSARSNVAATIGICPIGTTDGIGNSLPVVLGAITRAPGVFGASDGHLVVAFIVDSRNIVSASSADEVGLSPGCLEGTGTS